MCVVNVQKILDHHIWIILYPSFFMCLLCFCWVAPQKSASFPSGLARRLQGPGAPGAAGGRAGAGGGGISGRRANGRPAADRFCGGFLSRVGCPWDRSSCYDSIILIFYDVYGCLMMFMDVLWCLWMFMDVYGCLWMLMIWIFELGST
jgi:hypothetical protein